MVRPKRTRSSTAGSSSTQTTTVSALWRASLGTGVNLESETRESYAAGKNMTCICCSLKSATLRLMLLTPWYADPSPDGTWCCHLFIFKMQSGRSRQKKAKTSTEEKGAAAKPAPKKSTRSGPLEASLDRSPYLSTVIMLLAMDSTPSNLGHRGCSRNRIDLRTLRQVSSRRSDFRPEMISHVSCALLCTVSFFSETRFTVLYSRIFPVGKFFS